MWIRESASGISGTARRPDLRAAGQRAELAATACSVDSCTPTDTWFNIRQPECKVNDAEKPRSVAFQAAMPVFLPAFSKERRQGRRRGSLKGRSTNGLCMRDLSDSDKSEARVHLE